MSGTREKVRAIFLATIMLTSMVAASAAFAGTAAAGSNSGGLEDPLPSGPAGNTPTDITTFDATSEIANVSFDSGGSISNVSVDANSSDEGDVSTDSIDSVTVRLFNGSEELDNNTVDYDSHNKTVEFPSNGSADNVSNVSRVIVDANLANSNGVVDDDVIDTNLTLQTNPTGFVETQGTQTVTTNNGFFSGRVAEEGSNDDVQNATILVENTTEGFSKRTETDSEGDYSIAVPAGNYTVTADAPGFETASPKDGEIEAGQTTSANFVIERNVVATRLEVTDPADPHTVDLEDSFDATVLVETDDTDVNGIDNLAGLQGEEVNASNVSGEFSNPNDATASVAIDPSQNTTDETNTTQFNINLTLDGDADEYDEDIEAQILFEADTSDASDTLNVTFQAEPPSGDGTISGDVEEISEDIQFQPLSDNTAGSGSNVTVHAVTADRADENSDTLVAPPGADRVRVINNSTGEVLDVRTDYLVSSDDVAVTSNTSTPETSFDVNNATDSGSNSYTVTVLEQGTYRVQNDTGGTFVNQSTFTAQNNLTYEGTETRYDGVSAVHTDVTGDDGEFLLTNLFTNGSTGTDYTVIAGDGNANLGFANGYGYDTNVTVEQNTAPGDIEVNLGVQKVEAQPDSVNITNVGTLANTGDIDANYTEDLSEFNDTSDDVRQTIPRDGSTVDVIDVTTFISETPDNEQQGANVTLNNITNDGFNGQFVNESLGDDTVISHSDDEIEIDTGEDGEAVVFVETDNADAGNDSNVTIDAEMNNAAGTDSTDKLFEGVLDQQYSTGSITGVVTNEDQDDITAEVFVEEIQDEEEDIRFEIEPVTRDLEEFNVTLFNNATAPNANEIENETEVPAEELRGYTFDGFDTNISVANGQELTLLSEEAATRTTLSNVPAVDTDVSVALSGVQVITERRGSSVATAMEVNRTSTASIVIQGAVQQDDANFAVSNLTPTDAEVGPDEEFDVSATVENTGDLSDTQEIEFRIDGETEQNETLELSGGENETVEFDVNASDFEPGEYEHSIASDDDEAVGNLTILEEGVFTVSNLTPTDAEVAHNEVFDVNATIENTGEVTETQEIELRLEPDGPQVLNNTIELDAGENTSVNFEVDAANIPAGEYNHTIASEDDEESGNLTVLQQPIEYESGSITGIVTNEDNEAIQATVFVETIEDTENDVTFEIEPDSDALEDFTVTRTSATGETDSVEVTAEELRAFEFDGFDQPDVTLAEGEDPVTLISDGATSQATLSPVPTNDDVSIALAGVQVETGEDGTSVATPVEVNRTSTASIVIQGADPIDDNSTSSPDNGDDQPTASVTFDDQTVQSGDETITVDNANYTLADGTTGDYVVVAHVVNDDGSITDPVGYSSNVTGDTDDITVDLNASGAQDDALDTLTADTTLRAMLHETSSDSGFGPSLGLATDDATITVEAEDAPANFEVSSLDPQNVTVTQGDNITITATIENTGSISDTQTVEFRVGGTTVANETVELDGGNSTSVEFENVSTAGLAPGSYTHGVFTQDDNQTATLTVEEDTDDAPVVIGETPATDPDGDGTFEDVNGDGEFDIVDVNALFQSQDSDAVQNNVDAFDFNGDGEFDIVDVNALFQEF